MDVKHVNHAVGVLVHKKLDKTVNNLYHSNMTIEQKLWRFSWKRKFSVINIGRVLVSN